MDITPSHVIIAVLLFGFISLVINVLIFRKSSSLEVQLSSQAARIRDFEESLERFEENITKKVIELDVTLKNQLNEFDKSLKSTATQLQTTTEQYSQTAIDAINESFASLNKRQAAYLFKNKQENLANLEQLTSLIQTLRVSNLVELSNELARHQDLTIENEEFVKCLGDCKVTRVEDKYSGQITQIYYENNIKRSSDTYAGDLLKYQMFYSASGKPQRGLELNSAGQPIFEYLYDETGEVESQTEFEYDDAGKQVSKHHTSY
ncbi:hypothetical protein [Idiomarina sp.]|uniref:hypothetical protein n=1 Tax=Idiomarina sp. TaxID=1874361 RepID=UPI0025B83CD7|nr:hypothetical protein [Idiomarina sp.]NQZ04687.1 hypothetical protein [Idiomarina sp.]